MQIFISWSKPISHGLALALHGWLPDVINRLEPWMSSEDISKGQRWSTEVGERLDDTSQGIICVTRENMKEPWLNFEAGALAKSLRDALVRPILLDLMPSEIIGPLNQFQATIATDPKDMLKLVKSLNDSCDVPLEDTRLERAFERTWDEYLTAVRAAVKQSGTSGINPKRDVSDMVGEVLERVRDVQRSLAPAVDHVLPQDPVDLPRRRRGLSGMFMAELRTLATDLEIKNVKGMRKDELIAAIKEHAERHSRRQATE